VSQSHDVAPEVGIIANPVFTGSRPESTDEI
jgi:hypothetical protein